MKFKKLILVVMATVAMTSLGTTGCLSGEQDAATEPAAQAPVSEGAALLAPFATLAEELQTRSAAAQLSADWSAAWADVEGAQPPHTAAVASVADLLAAPAEALETYLRASARAITLLDQGALSGSLDARLLAIHQHLRSSIDGPAPATTSRARDFCCVVKMDPPVICHDWHTAAVWAGTKCVAAGVGLNRRGSTLYRGNCSSHPEC